MCHISFPSLRIGKRVATRYYLAPDTYQKDIIGRDIRAGFDAEMPAEWESWLRHRRDDPPTDEQVIVFASPFCASLLNLIPTF